MEYANHSVFPNSSKLIQSFFFYRNHKNKEVLKTLFIWLTLSQKWFVKNKNALLIHNLFQYSKLTLSEFFLLDWFILIPSKLKFYHNATFWNLFKSGAVSGGGGRGASPPSGDSRRVRAPPLSFAPPCAPPWLLTSSYKII